MEDGAQLFVRTTDVESVFAAIESYVRKHGCGGRYEMEDDRVDTLSERRSAREFAVALPVDGWVTIWEDGVLADRRLAEWLSSALGAEVRWMMISSSTGTEAAYLYDDGKEAAADIAAADDLPHAGVNLPDPTLSRYLAGLDIPELREHGITNDALDAALADRPDPAPPGTERRSYGC